jgi:hypothetical protein
MQKSNVKFKGVIITITLLLESQSRDESNTTIIPINQMINKGIDKGT